MIQILQVLILVVVSYTAFKTMKATEEIAKDSVRRKELIDTMKSFGQMFSKEDIKPAKRKVSEDKEEDD